MKKKKKGKFVQSWEMRKKKRESQIGKKSYGKKLLVKEQPK